MHIFYIIHYFPPELNGGATRASELARLWAEEGHRVTVLTGFPNHPHGRIPDQYRGRFYMEEAVDGYQVRRSFIYATPNKATVRRIVNHVSLTISSVLGSIAKGKPDIIIASSPPLFLGLSGYVLSRLRKAPYVFEVRDIWPQQAVDLGMLRNQHVIRAMEGLEFFLYRHAARVIGVAASTRRILSGRGLDPEKINIVFNGTDLEHFKPGPGDEAVKARLGLSHKFVVSYIGTIGLSQGLAVVLKAAKRLQKSHPSIHFLMVGDGAQRDMLVTMRQDMGLKNVTFVVPQPRSLVPDLYRISGATMVLLRRLPLFRSTIPSKMFEIMACGIPFILGVAGEARQIVEESDAGLCIEPENADELVNAILKLYDNEGLRSGLAARGRRYACAQCDRRRLARQYLGVLEEVVASSHVS